MSIGLANAPLVFTDLTNRVRRSYQNKFVIMFIDDILIYSKSKYVYEFEFRQVWFLNRVDNTRVIVPFEDVRVNEKLQFVEELIRIVDRDVGRFYRSRFSGSESSVRF